MARCFIQEGDTIDVVAPVGGIKSGDVLALGDLVGVALIDGAVGDTVSVALEGAASLPKKTGEAWAQGQKVYFDPDAETFTTTESDGLVWGGWAFVPAVAADILGVVKLRG